MKVKSKNEVSQSCPTLSDSMDCSLKASPSMGFSRQEYWSGVPLPFPESARLHPWDFPEGVLEWSAIAFSELKLDRAPYKFNFVITF